MKKTNEDANTKNKSSVKTILVTGASSGIGWATSLELTEKD